MDNNPHEHLQTRHSSRCVCNSPRPAVTNRVPVKTVSQDKIYSTARRPKISIKLKNSLQSLKTRMSAETVADPPGSGLSNVTKTQAVREKGEGKEKKNGEDGGTERERGGDARKER